MGIGVGVQLGHRRGKPVRLLLQRFGERQGLEAAGTFMLPPRVGAFDRVAQHRDELDPGQLGRDARRCQRVVQVVAAGLEGQLTAVQPLHREMPAIPAGPALIVQVEVANTLVHQRSDDAGVLRQGIEQGGGAGPGGADHQK
jgi:hypothetical protein